VKTIHQLVQEKIAHSAALATDPARFNMESNRLMIRLSNRMQNDPSLTALTAHFAQALAATLLVLPPNLHAQAIQSLLMQTVVEWEDVHAEFGAQLKPAPLG
jgi:hypothetical protein